MRHLAPAKTRVARPQERDCKPAQQPAQSKADQRRRKPRRGNRDGGSEIAPCRGQGSGVAQTVGQQHPLKRAGKAQHGQIRARPVKPHKAAPHVGLMGVTKAAAGQIAQRLFPIHPGVGGAGIELIGHAGQRIDLPAKALNILIRKGRKLRQGRSAEQRHGQSQQSIMPSAGPPP